MSHFTNWIRRSPILAFFVLAFGIEWLLFLVLRSVTPPLVALAIGSWLPNVVGVLVTGVAGGREGLRVLGQRLVRWRVGWPWYLIAWGAPMTLTLLTIAVGGQLGWPAPEAAPASAWLPLLLLNAGLGPLGEELGWRGTALPLMQARWNGLTASLALGVLWGLYHLPAFLMPGLPQNGVPLGAFLAGALAMNLFMVWMFNHTEGSLIMPCLAHLAFNFTNSALGMYSSPPLLWLMSGLWWLVCAALVVFDRSWQTHRVEARPAYPPARR